MNVTIKNGTYTNLPMFAEIPASAPRAAISMATDK